MLLTSSFHAESLASHAGRNKVTDRTGREAEREPVRNPPVRATDIAFWFASSDNNKTTKTINKEAS